MRCRRRALNADAETHALCRRVALILALEGLRSRGSVGTSSGHERPETGCTIAAPGVNQGWCEVPITAAVRNDTQPRAMRAIGLQNRYSRVRFPPVPRRAICNAPQTTRGVAF